jgi:phosphoenolpyruvate synthase/pyruvate phosphate dikinase
VSLAQLVSLSDLVTGTGGGPGKGGLAPGSCRTPGAIPPLAPPVTVLAVEVGFKAERLARALDAGLPVLPGWVVPVSAGRGAMEAGTAALRVHGVGAGRVAVLGVAVEAGLEEELRGVVDELGGQVIVRSSSPLEGDPVWAGAFSSVTGVAPDDVAGAVRSCWASAFAPDPLGRLDERGLPLEALEVAVLVQPEIMPKAGGVARIEPGCVAGVSVAGVRGHPGGLLSGWAEGARDEGLADLIGADTVADVAGLARRVYAELGDDVIEWGVCEGQVWLLQSTRSGTAAGPSTLSVPGGGTLVAGEPAAPGTAVGPLVACRPHETVARDCRDAILLVDRPVPALAPLLFGTRGVVARSGAPACHLAGVARSLGVPMVTGCPADTVTGPDPSGWFATVNGTTGAVTLLPGSPSPSA